MISDGNLVCKLPFVFITFFIYMYGMLDSFKQFNVYWKSGRSDFVCTVLIADVYINMVILYCMNIPLLFLYKKWFSSC